MTQTKRSDAVTFDRREFVAIGSGAFGIVLSPPVWAADIGKELPTHRFRVRRAADLLNLEFSFVNFEVCRDDLRAIGHGQSLVIVRFPPQNLAEQVFDFPASKPELPFEIDPIPEAPGTGRDPAPPIRSYLSGPSWVVFAVPDGMRLPFRCTKRRGGQNSVVDRWLRTMSDWKIRIPRNAEFPSTPVVMPRFDETCLEIPFRLFIAPSSRDTRWLTSSERLFGVDPQTSNTHELWHAALLTNHPLQQTQLPKGIDPNSIPPELKPPTRVMVQARAVFSPDYRANGTSDPVPEYYPGKAKVSHPKGVRHNLVKQMMAGDGLIDAEHLVLSALGADASLSYTSTKTFDELLQQQLAEKPEVDDGYLAMWKHRMVVGRDVFLMNVTFGFLFPFVYPALAVEITKRQFVSRKLEGGKFSAPGAYLLTERFILVVDPLKQFTNSGSSLGRKMPLKKALLTQTRTPLLADWRAFKISDDLESRGELDGTDDGRLTHPNSKFLIPRLLENADDPGADGMRWGMEFEDESGQRSRTDSACLLFATHVVTGRKLWQSLRSKFRQWTLPAQPISLAPERAELSVTAANDTKDASGQTVHKGQVLVQHTLGNEERRAARTVADAFRAKGARFNEFAAKIKAAGSNVDAFARSINELAGDASNQIKAIVSNLRQQTLVQLNAYVSAIEQEIKNGAGAEEHYLELLRQLQQAEQVTSTLETHLLEFDCGRVDKLYDAVRDKLGPFAQQAQNAQQFYDNVKQLGLSELDKSQNWESRIKSELQNRLQGLTNWDAQKREIIAYVDEFKDAVRQSENSANPYFHAQVARIEAMIPALKSLGDGAAIQPIQHLDDYLAKGMGDLGRGLSRVQNGAFARLSQAVDQGSAMADQIRCGVARPAAIVAGISRDLGALVGNGPDAINKIANQVSNVEALRPTLDDLKNAVPDAKLFSVLPLRALIKVLSGVEGIARAQLPVITLVNLPDHYEQVWEWTTPVGTNRFGILDFNVQESSDNPVSLHISSLTRVDTPKVDPATVAAGTAAAAKNLRGRVTVKGFLGYWDERGKKAAPPSEKAAFDLVILGMIDLPFYSVEFLAEGALGESPKTSIKPHMGEVQFLGPLKFVRSLQDLLAGLLGDNFQLTVTPEFVRVGFKVLLPPITFGVVTIRRISLGASLKISFTNEPLKFGFNFASFKEMFELTVMCFGGRGFFQVELATDGSRDLQGAIEFGGALAFDFTVASGDLYVMAGFYFRITNSQTDLSGYLRAGGNLYVLGLVHASVEFMLMGRYRTEKENGLTKHLIYGICTITVSIDLFLISFDVSITMEKKIAGSEEQTSEQAALSGKPLFRFASLQSASAPSEPIANAYFDREWRDVRGRYCAPTHNQAQGAENLHWKSAYWSQFAFND